MDFEFVGPATGPPRSMTIVDDCSSLSFVDSRTHGVALLRANNNNNNNNGQRVGFIDDFRKDAARQKTRKATWQTAATRYLTAVCKQAAFITARNQPPAHATTHAILLTWKKKCSPLPYVGEKMLNSSERRSRLAHVLIDRFPVTHE